MRQQSRCSFKSMRSYHHQNSTSTKHPNLNSWSIVGLTLMAASTYKVQQESLDTTQQLNLFKDCLNQRAFVDNRTWILCYFVRQEGQVWVCDSDLRFTWVNVGKKWKLSFAHMILDHRFTCRNWLFTIIYRQNTCFQTKHETIIVKF